MIQPRAYIPKVLEHKGQPLVLNFFVIGLGVFLLSLLAQLTVRLPITPVPVTGQTFGVLFLSLLLGSRLSILTVGSYLLVGAIGLPVFALGASGLFMGSTVGYLFGMLVASFIVGCLADRGWASSFRKAFLAGLAGMVVIFAFGLFVLSFYVPQSVLLSFGLIPFLPGALLKTSLAAALSTRVPSFRSLSH